MTLLISACLLGENCKYSGGNNRNERVLRYAAGHRVIPVCPEVEGGLPCPRKPVEWRDGRVVTAAGMGVAQEFGLELVSALVSPEKAGNIRTSIQSL